MWMSIRLVSVHNTFVYFQVSGKPTRRRENMQIGTEMDGVQNITSGMSQSEYNTFVIPAHFWKQRNAFTYRCPYCVKFVTTERRKMISHILDSHKPESAREALGVRDSFRRMENLTKRGERVIDRARVEQHFSTFKTMFSQTPNAYRQLMRCMELCLLEAMAIIGDETDFRPRRYTELREAYSKFCNCNCYSEDGYFKW